MQFKLSEYGNWEMVAHADGGWCLLVPAKRNSHVKHVVACGSYRYIIELLRDLYDIGAREAE